MNKPIPTFEESLPIIDIEIAKRRHKWNLSSLTWMDYDDVAQIIRIHIYKKWSQYNPLRPMQPWLNTIITNQIRNLIRNVYSNYSRPCLKCADSQEPDGCTIYGTQCSDCPLFAYWMKRKQPATQIKIPVSIENHVDEVANIFDDSFDIAKHAKLLHAKMKEILKPTEWTIYEGLFILGLGEEEVARNIGYKSNEKGRIPGYKQIRNVSKSIIEKARKCIQNGEIDMI